MKIQIETLLRHGRHLALVAALLAPGCQKHSPAPETPEAPAAKVDGDKISVPATYEQKGSLTVAAAESHKPSTTRVTGRLMWDDDITVHVFTPFGGRVEKIETDLGANVSCGDVLARIASPDLGQAQADAHRAAGDLNLAERSLTRVRELYAHGAAAKKDVDSAEADLTRATSERDRASARLKLYSGSESAIDQVFPLKTPIAGIVVEKNINNGQEVRADQMLGNDPRIFSPLFVVTDPTRLWLQLDVTESDLGSLQQGQALRVFNKAFPNRSFKGRIELIGSAFDPATRTVKMRAVVENPEMLLKAEMYVTAELALDVADKSGSGAEVDRSAVFMKDNQRFLFVEESPGHFVRRVVVSDGESNGRIRIKGLATGQRVVMEGCLLLQALMDAAPDKS